MDGGVLPHLTLLAVAHLFILKVFIFHYYLHFSAIFKKGNNFCDFLNLLNTYRKGSILKGKNLLP